VVDERTAARADVVCSGDSLFVLSFHPGETRFLAYDYEPEERGYRLRDRFPVQLAPLPLEGAETMVLARDGTGRLWAAYLGERPGQERGEARAIWSEDEEGRHWNLNGVVLGEDADPDDIAAAFWFRPASTGQVGVIWSRQSACKSRDRGTAGDSQLIMRVHRDDDPPDRWGPQEVAASGPGLVDDHLNTAAARDGTLFVVTKTSLDDLVPVNPDDALLKLYARSPEGAWSGYPVCTCREPSTRPIVVLDEEQRLLSVFYTQHVGDGKTERRIVRRSSTVEDIRFTGPAEAAIAWPGLYMNDVTSTKQNVTQQTGLVVMCGCRDKRRGGPHRAYFRRYGPGPDPTAGRTNP
jgi:hypothetical protein